MSKKPISFRPPRKAAMQTPVGQLLSSIRNLLEADASEFRALAEAADLDPKLDFRYVELNGVPLAEQDLRGFDFTGADLRDTGVERARHDSSSIFASARFSGPSLDPAVKAFNQRIKNLSFAEAEAAVQRKLENRRYADVDVYTFTLMVKKAPNEERTKFWFDAMRSAGIIPDLVAFSALISKAQSETTAAQWFAEMLAAGVTPNDVTFTTLMSKAETEEHADRWFTAMRDAGMAPDDVTYNTLIAKAKTSQHAEQWYKTMRAAGVAPDVYTFTSLIDIAPDLSRASYWLDQMKAEGVEPNDATLRAFAKKQSNSNRAQ